MSAAEPIVQYQHSENRPLPGRKIAGNSQRELRRLGFVTDSGTGAEDD